MRTPCKGLTTLGRVREAAMRDLLYAIISENLSLFAARFASLLIAAIKEQIRKYLDESYPELPIEYRYQIERILTPLGENRLSGQHTLRHSPNKICRYILERHTECPHYDKDGSSDADQSTGPRVVKTVREKDRRKDRGKA